MGGSFTLSFLGRTYYSQATTGRFALFCNYGDTSATTVGHRRSYVPIATSGVNPDNYGSNCEKGKRVAETKGASPAAVRKGLSGTRQSSTMFRAREQGYNQRLQLTAQRSGTHAKDGNRATGRSVGHRKSLLAADARRSIVRRRRRINGPSSNGRSSFQLFYLFFPISFLML